VVAEVAVARPQLVAVEEEAAAEGVEEEAAVEEVVRQQPEEVAQRRVQRLPCRQFRRFGRRSY
jgi:hypothetical protein